LRCRSSQKSDARQSDTGSAGRAQECSFVSLAEVPCQRRGSPYFGCSTAACPVEPACGWMTPACQQLDQVGFAGRQKHEATAWDISTLEPNCALHSALLFASPRRWPSRFMEPESLPSARIPHRLRTRASAKPGSGKAIRRSIRAVTLGGSPSTPILGIAGSAPAGTTWVQFLVDSLGQVDSTSALLPPDADPATVATVNAVLPRVRFSPARKAGTPTCERLQMQVNLNGGSR
jgi:hypothetical protein